MRRTFRSKTGSTPATTPLTERSSGFDTPSNQQDSLLNASPALSQNERTMNLRVSGSKRMVCISYFLRGGRA
jgi:hypothetical protein